MTRVLAPTAVPSLDELAADPARATTLPAAALHGLLCRCLAVQTAIMRALLAVPTTQTPSPARLVDAAEMADLLGTPENWVRDRARAGHIPFVRLGHYMKFSPREVLEAVRHLPVQHNQAFRGIKKGMVNRDTTRRVSTGCPTSSDAEGAKAAD
jgi:excisionase family DNA binding protein